MWAFGWKIEESAFKIVSAASMTIAFFYVLIQFIVGIQYLKKYSDEDWQYIIGVSWDDPDHKDDKTAYRYGVASVVIALLQFISSQIYFKTYNQSKIKEEYDLKNRPTVFTDELDKKFDNAHHHAKKKHTSFDKFKSDAWLLLKNPYTHLFVN